MFGRGSQHSLTSGTLTLFVWLSKAVPLGEPVTIWKLLYETEVWYQNTCRTRTGIYSLESVPGSRNARFRTCSGIVRWVLRCTLGLQTRGNKWSALERLSKSLGTYWIRWRNWQGTVSLSVSQWSEDQRWRISGKVKQVTLSHPVYSGFSWPLPFPVEWYKSEPLGSPARRSSKSCRHRLWEWIWTEKWSVYGTCPVRYTCWWGTKTEVWSEELYWLRHYARKTGRGKSDSWR